MVYTINSSFDQGDTGVVHMILCSCSLHKATSVSPCSVHISVTVDVFCICKRNLAFEHVNVLTSLSCSSTVTMLPPARTLSDS